VRSGGERGRTQLNLDICNVHHVAINVEVDVVARGAHAGCNRALLPHKLVELVLVAVQVRPQSLLVLHVTRDSTVLFYYLGRGGGRGGDQEGEEEEERSSNHAEKGRELCKWHGAVELQVRAARRQLDVCQGIANEHAELVAVRVLPSTRRRERIYHAGDRSRVHVGDNGAEKLRAAVHEQLLDCRLIPGM
jgi:hypothetical protein